MDPFRVLSWGCGLQSTVLGEMSARGDLERLDLIITADTQWERQITYDVRDWYTERWRGMGMNVETITFGSVKEKGAAEHVHIPFFTDSGGPLNRQCTPHFKIKPIRRRIRELLGFHPSKAPAPKAGAVETWLGITVDEWTRATRSDVQFIRNRWPLLELKMFREDCAAWLEERGLLVPPKSACIGCPYRTAIEWIEMRDTSPGEWAQAVAFDEANRCNPLAERGGSTADELYIFKTTRGEPTPLAEVDLEHEVECMRRKYGGQLPMFACESGYCGL